jgi:hypothetical protein
MLSFRQEVHENDRAVRKQQGIVMLVHRFLIYAELGNTEAGTLGRQPVAIVSHILLECELGAGEEANRDGRFALDSKAAG